MNVRYTVELSDQERTHLDSVVAAPNVGPQKRKRAQLLLACDRGISEVVIAETLPCGTSTIYRTKKRLVEMGFEAARRIPDRTILERDVKAWSERRGASGERIKWMFTVDAARTKLGRRYPHVAGLVRHAA